MLYEVLPSILSECIGGLLALLCAVVGAKIATKSEKRQEKVRALRDSYADVFAGYYACMMDASEKNSLLLVTSIERAMLICSEDSVKIICDTLPIFASQPLNIERLGKEIQRLRTSAKEDVRNAERK